MSDLQFARIPRTELSAFTYWIHADCPALKRHAIDSWLQEEIDQNKLPWLALGLKWNQQWLLGVYALVYPGKLGVVSGLRILPDLDPQASAPWIEVALQQLQQMGAHLIQRVFDGKDDVQIQRHGAHLEAAGMRHLARLLQLECEVSLTDSLAEQESIARFLSHHREYELAPFQSHDANAWLEILEVTYRDSQDCPELNGVRAIHDTWEGYAAAASHDLSEWWMLRYHQTPVGCLLLTPMPTQRMELTYLGIHPEHRGKGLGALLVQHAKHRCFAAHTSHLQLAVDERNTAAINIYQKAGFAESGSLHAWFWSPTSLDQSA